ncbi:hypothetical protein Vadar_010048 [Vaccinium darrowii]|uniref:Uncharacterized protein n=1 Tax=Vaccinium darrowii TaxID=229202 RepID=A0ACB7WZH5_9ERIC|nr:hypothetical protein Vadar_010048 [Vaccinium darrowii]
MIAVMKYEHRFAILECLIMQRWTRRARPEGQQPNVSQISRSLTRKARYGILSSHYNLMSFYASHEEESFQLARQVGEQMTSCMRKRWEMRNNGSKNEVGETSGVASKFGVADPIIVKLKGKPAHNSKVRKPWAPRKCNHWKGIGHNKRTCSKLSSNKCGLEPICNIKGSANLHLVQEFFKRIFRDTVDTVNMVFETVVQGKRIVVMPDHLAKILKFKRPQPDEAQYPYKKSVVRKPEREEIWPTLCEKGCEPDEDGKILLRDLKDDFLILHHIFGGMYTLHPHVARSIWNRLQCYLLCTMGINRMSPG